MPLAVVLAALLAAAGPPSQAPAGGTPEPRQKIIGLQLSAGAPDGIAVAATLRPIPWLRADLGAAYNILSFGIVGGATVVPWSGPVMPTFRLGAGQFFNSDVRKRFGSTFPAALDPALERFGYHFVSALVGLEMGNENGSLFFVRGGLAWVGSGLESTTYKQGNTTLVARDNTISATTPSVQLGVLFHVW